MTKVFVLIFATYPSFGPAVEFSSLGECDRAGKLIQSVWGSARYACVEKTTIPVAR